MANDPNASFSRTVKLPEHQVNASSRLKGILKEIDAKEIAISDSVFEQLARLRQIDRQYKIFGAKNINTEDFRFLRPRLRLSKPNWV
jgi:hypothetical protein